MNMKFLFRRFLTPRNLYATIADDSITRQIIIRLEEAGSLPYRIGFDKKSKITNLKIIGEINVTDLRMIREMAGRDYDNLSTNGRLAILDLSEADIVNGGDSHVRYDAYSGWGSCPAENNKLGEGAFRDCNRLTSITLPSSVVSIDEYAFQDCSNLTSLALTSNTTSINWRAFSGCNNLKEVRYYISEDLETYLEKGHPYIGINAGIQYFLNSRKITSLDIPSGVTSIGSYAFAHCRDLTSLTIPPGVTSIGASAFAYCRGLTSLVIPSSVTLIGTSAFWGCNNLTSVYVSRETPLKITANTFHTKCTLYVPRGSYQDYWLAEGWGNFENIVEYDAD